MAFDIKIFGERVKDSRGEKTIVQVAQAIGVNHSTVSKWENGLIMPGADSIYLLAKFFGVSADYLIGLEN